MIDQLLTTAAWTSPLGLGVFMVCFGLFVFLCGRAGAHNHYWHDHAKDKKK